ncbi:MAG: tetratricopeptide repeat protein [Candidatus Acidiferrum sp.]
MRIPGLARDSHSTKASCAAVVLVIFLSFTVRLYCQNASPQQTFESIAKRAAESRDANHLEEAALLYHQALALHPKWAEGWWSLGTLEYDRNHYAEAAAAFRHLLPLAPKDGAALVMLGLSEFELGQDDKAFKHLEAGKSLGIPANPQLEQVLLFHEGVLLRRQGKFESAQLSLGQLCSEGVQSREIIRELGLVMLRIDGNNAPPENSPGAEVVRRVGYAACLTSEKKFDQAQTVYAELTEKYPEYPNLHYAYGMFFSDSGNPASAVDQFKQEISHNPLDVASRLRIVSTLYKSDSAAALPYAQQAVHLDPHLPFAHYLLGLIYLDTDDYLKAIPELEIARRAFPEDPKVYFALGSAYSRAGRKKEADEARAAFQKLSEKPPAAN